MAQKRPAEILVFRVDVDGIPRDARPDFRRVLLLNQREGNEVDLSLQRGAVRKQRNGGRLEQESGRAAFKRAGGFLGGIHDIALIHHLADHCQAFPGFGAVDRAFARFVQHIRAVGAENGIAGGEPRRQVRVAYVVIGHTVVVQIGADLCADGHKIRPGPAVFDERRFGVQIDACLFQDILIDKRDDGVRAARDRILFPVHRGDVEKFLIEVLFQPEHARFFGRFDVRRQIGRDIFIRKIINVGRIRPDDVVQRSRAEQVAHRVFIGIDRNVRIFERHVRVNLVKALYQRLDHRLFVGISARDQYGNFGSNIFVDVEIHFVRRLRRFGIPRRAADQCRGSNQQS